MSTRRARIKAVTSLPPRRKNNDNVESNKNTVLPNEEAEKALKSPKTPRGVIKSHEIADRNSPKTVPISPRQSPRPVNNIFKTTAERVPSPAVSENTTITPKRSEKVSVITSTSSAKYNVFVSPKSVGSPIRKPPAFLQAQPKVDNQQTQKLLTPENVNIENKQKTVIEKSGGKCSDKNKSRQSSVYEISQASVAQTPDNYNVPSVPERVTDDTGMDGIVPLQPVGSAPKPIALLKNEIISENAEVLFDPIVPLPSPSKVRPKLRPVPRLAPLRRNSVQGSASESEDESRRALHASGAVTPAPQRQRHDSHTSHSTMVSLPPREVNRIRNDSICSSVSQSTVLPPTATSPVKEKQTKARRNDMSRRMAMRRRRETVKRDALTMYDLIFYNPTTNPIVPDQDEIKIQEANEAQALSKAVKDKKEEEEEKPDDIPEQDAAPVPQIKLGPNGEIILDEQSLVIKSSDKRKVSEVVHEGAWTGPALGRYRRSARTADWSDAETVRFYRALAALGTDFMLMERLFPGRTRKDLKLKFKKEERINGAQIDKALRSSVKWDCMRLEEEFKVEREAAEKKAKADEERLKKKAQEEKERLKAAKELKGRQSRGSKVLGDSILPGVLQGSDGLTADSVIQRHQETKTAKKRTTRPKKPPPPRTPIPKVSSKPHPSPSQFATLSRVPNNRSSVDRKAPTPEMATISKIDPKQAINKTPDVLNSNVVPSNIESGSLVVLTVNDPNSPSKKMLQTYIAHGGGRLTPVALPTSFLNSVVSYMKKGTPKSTMSTSSSPHLTSPSSVASQDSRTCSTPGVIQITPSPRKRQRNSSYTVMQL